MSSGAVSTLARCTDALMDLAHGFRGKETIVHIPRLLTSSVFEVKTLESRVLVALFACVLFKVAEEFSGSV